MLKMGSFASLGGGIAPRIVDVLCAGPFRRGLRRQAANGVVSGAVPVYVILSG